MDLPIHQPARRAGRGGHRPHVGDRAGRRDVAGVPRPCRPAPTSATQPGRRHLLRDAERRGQRPLPAAPRRPRRGRHRPAVFGWPAESPAPGHPTVRSGPDSNSPSTIFMPRPASASEHRALTLASVRAKRASRRLSPRRSRLVRGERGESEERVLASTQMQASPALVAGERRRTANRGCVVLGVLETAEERSQAGERAS